MGKKNGNRSIIGVIIRVLVCKRCSFIDQGVLVALAIIDLLKPYFHIISGFCVRGRTRQRFKVVVGALIIHNVFVLSVQIALFTLQVIHVRYITHPEGTSRRRNLGRLALIFRDQCITRLLSIWGPHLATLQRRVESARRPRTNYRSVYRAAG